jgi:hypothetical protein
MCIHFPLNQNSAVLLHVNCGVGEPLMYEQGRYTYLQFINYLSG